MSDKERNDNHEMLKLKLVYSFIDFRDLIILIKLLILLFKLFNHENRDSEDKKPPGILSEEADH